MHTMQETMILTVFEQCQTRHKIGVSVNVKLKAYTKHEYGISKYYHRETIWLSAVLELKNMIC